MLIFNVDHDMDHAGMSAVRASFDELARSPQDVGLDLSQVRFMDSAVLSGMAALGCALRRRSLKRAIAHAQGQPLRLLRGVPLARAAARTVMEPDATDVARKPLAR